MDFSRPMSVITPTVDGDVLTALAQADASFTPGRLHKVIGRHSEDGVRRALRRLVRQGVVEDQAAGKAMLYRLNREHLAARSIIDLASLWETFVARLGERFLMWSVQPRVAVLFGSVARGAMELDSDVDIFVVRPTDAPASDGWDSDVRSLEDDATRWTGNDVRVLEMTEAHVERHGADEPVLRDILSEGVRLAGDLEWLRRTVRRASTSGSG